jgi:hypothetical protein
VFAPRPDRENDKDIVPSLGFPDGTKSFLSFGVKKIGLNKGPDPKYRLDLISGDAMLENFRDITVIPIESRKSHASFLIIETALFMSIQMYAHR